MNTFKTAILTLRHPLTLTGIGLLLLNDHVFKIYFPSPLTGKLSDFAGLFFFPFLVIAAISLAGGWLGISEKRLRPVAPAAAFGLTGIVFALLKVSPWANGMAAELSRWIFGAPAWIVLDPTDLMALLVFVPAWVL